MRFSAFSKKQLRVLCWWCGGSRDSGYDAIICDGAVRSGKTLCMSVSFVAWAFYRFENRAFALCGKTVTSLRRNVISGLLPILRSVGFNCRYLISRNLITIEKGGRVNDFYLFGGRDESSASLIQGITLAGVLFDEVALMPRSFVEQALARCSLAGSKFWFNCNPEHPGHWFYGEWIKQRQKKNALYLHFTMEDNPSLSAEIRERYRSLYSGSFYQRFIEGRWVAAKGLVYPFFDKNRHICKASEDGYGLYYISCDYGTVNPASFGLWGKKDDVWYRVREYYYDSKKNGAQKTDGEYYDELERLAGDLKIEAVICDPSAASFITLINKMGRFSAVPARNDVLDGIRRTAGALKSGKILFDESCADSIREFEGYRWEDCETRDAPKKQNDHAMDDIRYFVSHVFGGEPAGFFAVAAER